MKKIYLTFDDGPLGGTSNVLTAVKQANIPASFFIVGKHVFESPWQTALWEQMKNTPEIEVYNHSYTHAHGMKYNVYYNSQSDYVKNDMIKNQERLNFNSKTVRMPGRNAWRIGNFSYTDVQLSKLAIDGVHNAGFNPIGWDVEWKENDEAKDLDDFLMEEVALLPPVEDLIKEIQKKLKPGKSKRPDQLVILMHDQYFRLDKNLEQLTILFQRIKELPGCTPALLSSFPGL